MKRKSIFALAFAIALALAAGTTFSTMASGLNQASNPSMVKYGVVNEEYKALLESRFDAMYYAESNQDVVDVLGTDFNVLFGHFIKCGLWEGRKGWPDFDPAAYASAYPDLREAFGNDILSYYIHYIMYGQAEGRTITTEKACKDNGITLVPFFDNAIKVDANNYHASELMGTTDYDSVQEAVNTANSNGEPVAVYNADTGESYVVAPSGTCLPEGYEKLGTIKTNGDAEIIIYKATSGYAAKTNDGNHNNIDEIASVTVTVMSQEAYNSSIANSQLPDDYSTTGIPESGNFVLDTGVQYSGASDSYGTMTSSDEATGTNEGNLHITQYGEDYDFNIGIDENGTDDSTYDYGTVVEDNGDGTVTVTVVVTNPDTGMVHNETYTFTDGEN